MFRLSLRLSTVETQRKEKKIRIHPKLTMLVKIHGMFYASVASILWRNFSSASVSVFTGVKHKSTIYVEVSGRSM